MPVETLRSHLSRLRARYRQLLREEVAATLGLADDVDEELAPSLRDFDRRYLAKEPSHACRRERSPRCEQCGSTLEGAASLLGCLNCLRLAVLGEEASRVAAFSITKSACVMTARLMSWAMERWASPIARSM